MARCIGTRAIHRAGLVRAGISVAVSPHSKKTLHAADVRLAASQLKNLRLIVLGRNSHAAEAEQLP